jgi:hypothetical protein
MTAPTQTPTATSDSRLGPVALAGAAAAGCLALAFVGGTDGGPVLCPLRATTGWDCPMCGATRGVRALLTGNPLQALSHNLLLVVVLPALAWSYLAWAAPRFGRNIRPLDLSGRAVAALVVAMAVFGVARNLPIDSLTWLDSN